MAAKLAERLALFMRQRHAHGAHFGPLGVIVIDLQHISECVPGDALLETMETALEEFVHFRHPRWSEQRVKLWVKKTIHPRRKLLVEFTKGLVC